MGDGVTLTQLDAKSATLDTLRFKWEARLLARVRDKVTDAHAHGQKALTDRLKATDDGRRSILHLNQSPSYQAARERLNELWTWLAGPSELSLKGKIRDARADFLREASWLWYPLIPEAIVSRSDHQPTLAQTREIRAAAIHGIDPRKYLEGPIGNALRTLKATLEQAGRSSATDRLGIDLLNGWENRAVGSLSMAVRVLLSDSVVYADNAAGRSLVHSDYIEI